MIRVLDKNVADKIAAGEVVDRPVSIVKELIENAIDAGAGAITVEIKNGGKTYIRVTDDGCGIETEQVQTAFLRHATSKISLAEDLETIETLGFRGEALASIAAVSRTELITKTKDAKTGTRLAIEGSQVVEQEPIGCPDGTTIVVRDLFYNTPARQKFMKTDRSETNLIVELVSQIAMGYAHIRVRLINNETLLFSTQGKGDRYKNILTIYNKEIGENLIPVQSQVNYLHLEGYISSPGQSRATRKHQIFFINGRVVNSKVLENGITQAFSDKLFNGRYPIAFLFLHVDPGQLDVNIHPNKRQVRFNDEVFVREFMYQALIQALRSKESIPEVKKDRLPKRKSVAAVISAPTKNKMEKSVSMHEAEIKEEQVDIKILLSTIREEEETLQVKEDEKSYTFKTPPPFDFSQLVITGAIFGTYITAVDDNCFYLIDQHAAHERIFFERLMQQYNSQEKHRQSIMLPIVLEISFGMAQGEWSLILNRMGFRIEEFGPKTYLAKEIPLFMGLEEAELFLKDFIDCANDGKIIDNQHEIEKLIMRSCKGAVKAHDYLKEAEIKQLIQDLSQCENPFSCPHGRPTFIKMSQHEIERMFKRV